jgi:cytochrome c peroxidase
MRSALPTILLAGCAAASAQPQGEHGAAPAASQQAALDALKLTAPIGLAPTGVDSVIWGVVVPKDNAITEARVALGRKLYFDTSLSADGTVSCATCHDVTRSFTDRRNAAEGIGGKVGRRNTPTTMNAALLGTQFWDGRAATLEAQAVLPITNPIEMGHPSNAAAVAAVKKNTAYEPMFQAAYGRGVNIDDIGRALASFERTLIFLDAPFDRYTSGQQAMSADAVAGWQLFNGKARCATCHPISLVNPLGTDNRFHNIGVSARAQDFAALSQQAIKALGTSNSLAKIEELALASDANQLGRFLITRNASDLGSFRTSQLRNVGITAPYMHDGSMQTLWDVMDHYNKGGEPHAHLDGGIEPLALTESEIDQVVAFLFALTDVRFAQQNAGEQAAQRGRAATQRPFRDTERATRKTITFKSTAK